MALEYLLQWHGILAHQDSQKHHLREKRKTTETININLSGCYLLFILQLTARSLDSYCKEGL